MKGYLERLIARAEGTSAVLAPRMRSLFEPADERGAALEIEHDSAASQISSPHTAQPSAAARAPEVLVRACSDASAAPPGPLLEAREPEPSASARVVGARDSSVAIAPHASRRDEASHETARQIIAARQITTGPLLAEPARAQREQRSAAVDRRPAAEQVSRTEPAGSTAKRPPREQAPAPVKQRGALQPELALRGRAFLPPTAAKHTPPLPAALDPKPDVEPPRIEVSIGRVEIHALPPTAAASTRQAGRAGPRLSLDEYLRQRNGASR